ncbi:MAG: cation:proton antiporter [Lentisphaeria bacterium]|nr:cation:proton antiporter [Lentisphaeria bacterium]
MWEIQNPVLIFSVLMVIFLFAPLIAEKLRIPELVLLLLAGTLLGENGLGVLKRDGSIELFGQIGLLYIMFIAGLETDADDFRRSAKRSLIFGVISFLIPQLLGTLIAFYWLNFSWMSSILLASMFASHTLIAYPIASRLGLSKSEPVVVTVSGTIFTNTLSLLVLAVVADASRGHEMGLVFWFTMFGGMGILTFVICYILPKIAGMFFRNISEKDGAQFVFVLGTVCLCAYWSYYAKMEPIIGAFLAGVAFNRLIPERSTLMNRLVFFGNTFFIPFFLISVGMLINPKSLVASPRGILVAVVMSLSVIVTKYMAAELTGRLFHYTKAENKVIFGLSVAQAAATLAAVMIGHQLKIFDETVLNGTIVMILVSCSLGCYCVDRYGRVAAASIKRVVTTVRRQQRIVIGFGSPDMVNPLLNLAIYLHNPNAEGKIFPVAVVNDHDDKSSEKMALAEKMLSEAISQAAAAQIQITPQVRLATNPADGLVRCCRELHGSLLLAGWSRQNIFKTKIWGGISDHLLKNCPARLLFCRIKSPLNLCRRLWMPLPEQCNLDDDFIALLKLVDQLSSQIGVELNLLLPEKISAICMTAIEKEFSSRRFRVLSYSNWKTFINILQECSESSDMLFLPMERRESAAWQPFMEQVQEAALTEFKQINLLTCYPPLPEDPAAGSEELLNELALPPSDYLHGVDLKSSEVDSALPQLVEANPEFSDPAKSQLPGALKESLLAYPLELSEQVVLIHARSELVTACSINVGYSSNGIVSNGGGRKMVVLALISPANEQREEHLTVLANLARLFMDKEFTEAVEKSDSAGKILALLHNGLEKIKQA